MAQNLTRNRALVILDGRVRFILDERVEDVTGKIRRLEDGRERYPCFCGIFPRQEDAVCHEVAATSLERMDGTTEKHRLRPGLRPNFNPIGDRWSLSN
jgi:hypothetical protein